jgi:hypothetical protein
MITTHDLAVTGRYWIDYVESSADRQQKRDREERIKKQADAIKDAARVLFERIKLK